MFHLPARLLIPFVVSIALVGCSANRACFPNDDYLKAEDRPPLRLPPGLVASERIAPLQIPAVDPNPEKLDPEPRCLDQPPPYAEKPAGPQPQ